MLAKHTDRAEQCHSWGTNTARDGHSKSPGRCAGHSRAKNPSLCGTSLYFHLLLLGALWKELEGQSPPKGSPEPGQGQLASGGVSFPREHCPSLGTALAWNIWPNPALKVCHLQNTRQALSRKQECYTLDKGRVKMPERLTGGLRF